MWVIESRPAATVRTAVEAGPATACGLSSAAADADPALFEHTQPENGSERHRNEHH
jgi:hypothetical protein